MSEFFKQFQKSLNLKSQGLLLDTNLLRQHINAEENPNKSQFFCPLQEFLGHTHCTAFYFITRDQKFVCKVNFRSLIDCYRDMIIQRITDEWRQLGIQNRGLIKPITSLQDYFQSTKHFVPLKTLGNLTYPQWVNQRKRALADSGEILISEHIHSNRDSRMNISTVEASCLTKGFISRQDILSFIAKYHQLSQSTWQGNRQQHSFSADEMVKQGYVDFEH